LTRVAKHPAEEPKWPELGRFGFTWNMIHREDPMHFELSKEPPEDMKRHWLPETLFMALVLGGSFAWVVWRFWP
jgi:hypothetical protein